MGRGGNGITGPVRPSEVLVDPHPKSLLGTSNIGGIAATTY